MTFEERGGKTLLVLITNSILSEKALDANAGMENAMAETFAQLDELLATLARA